MTSRVAGSFRDPAGHVFERDGILYRLVSSAGRAAYQRFMRSGLYDVLAQAGDLIPHDELGERPDLAEGGIVLQPARLRLVSYPYEWAFSALRDAALLTLSIAREANRHGLRLKDASAFNVQFDGCRPVFIDTLSFEPSQAGPWPAYHQFCEHFVVPLAMMSTRDVRLGKLFRTFPEGIPLGLASSLMPRRTWLRPGLFMHLHAHAWAECRLTGPPRPTGPGARKGPEALALFDSLEATIRGLSWQPTGGWTNYVDQQASYSDQALAEKLRVVGRWLDRLEPGSVWDLGANTGRFSRLAAARSDLTVALDADAACVERIYRQARLDGTTGLLPLVFDLAAPTPAIGWANQERPTLVDRGRGDLLLALALIHHVAIARGVPLPHIAEVFARLGRHAIVEFVPKTDPMVQRLLAHRDDVFSAYSREHFESAFAERFTIADRVPLPDSDRALYLMLSR
jgi:hypothetical protein